MTLEQNRDPSDGEHTMLERLTEAMVHAKSPMAFMALWAAWAPLHTVASITELVRARFEPSRPIRWPGPVRHQRGPRVRVSTRVAPARA